MRTPAQLAQLAALHATTRGRRVHPPLAPEVLEKIQAALAAGLWKKRALARRVGVSDTTLARWLRGIDNPRRSLARKLQEVICE